MTTSPGDILVLYHRLQLQCNPVNTVTNGPKRFGRINGGFFMRKCMAVFYQAAKKKPR